MVTLFELEMEEGGLIILDLFQRDGSITSKSTQVSTLTERGSSKMSGQTGVAYVTMNLPREAFQYLNFDLVKTLFHEFGHALNIGMSQTKYQYLSGARGTLDSIEIPSHFCELFLTDYAFVSQFALI